MENMHSDKVQDIIDCLSKTICGINVNLLNVSTREAQLRIFEEHLSELRRLYRINKFSDEQVETIVAMKESTKGIMPEYTKCNGEVFFKSSDGVYRKKSLYLHHESSGQSRYSVDTNFHDTEKRRTIYNTETAVYSRTENDNNY
jgi:hypothetical protein